MSDETYANVDESQWNQTPARKVGADDTQADEEPMVTDADDEMAPDEGGTIVQAETPAGADVSVQMNATGRTERGDIVVRSAGQMNAGAANDGKTEDGIGQEFGVWGDEFVHIDDTYVLPRPDGQTKAGVERIAGREGELRDIHKKFYLPATEGGEFVIPRKRAEIEQREADRTARHREELSRQDHAAAIKPAFDYFADEDTRQQAREDAVEPHHDFHPNHLESASELVACRWADRTNGERTPVFRGSISGPDPVEDDWQDDLLMELTMELMDSVADSAAFEDLSMSVRDVKAAVKDALEATDRNPTGAIIKASEELFHDGSQSLADIEPWWTGATARVRVEELYTPNDPTTTQQVGRVTDVAPTINRTSTGPESAKLTIWNRSDVDVTLAEGDIVELANVKPGRFGDQLTLAATSDTTVYRLHRGDGPAPTRTDALRGDGEATPQSLDVLESNSTVSIDYSEGPKPLSAIRFRRPERTAVIGDLGWNESAAVHGSEAHRDPVMSEMTWVFPSSAVPEWFEADDEHVEPMFRQMDADEAVIGEDPFSAAELAGDYEAIPSAKMKAVIDLFPDNFERAHSVRSHEHVFQTVTQDDMAVRIYSSVVGQWARPNGESRIVVTIEDLTTGDVEVVDRLNRTEGWPKRLAAATRKAVTKTTTNEHDDEA
ncbi:MAG: hypothetical protein ACI8U4_000474 [Natronomonas sp.]|jgi:hypothetical protein